MHVEAVVAEVVAGLRGLMYAPPPPSTPHRMLVPFLLAGPGLMCAPASTLDRSLLFFSVFLPGATAPQKHHPSKHFLAADGVSSNTADVGEVRGRTMG